MARLVNGVSYIQVERAAGATSAGSGGWFERRFWRLYHEAFWFIFASAAAMRKIKG
ncbi:MAG: hypothetical protein WA624_02690 [Methylocella sp.]